MPKVTVYKIKLYDVATDQIRISRRMATREGADVMRGEIIPESAVEIDAARLERGEKWTERDFEP